MADITVLVQSPGLVVWGGGNWGELAYSAQGYTEVSVGQVSAYNELGWGGGEYGEQDWGQLSDGGVVVSSLLATTALSSVSIEILTEFEVTGIAATTSIGQAESDVLNNGWGARTWGFSVWGSVGDVILTGQQLTASTGQATIDPTFLIGEGWGRDTFGNLAWGVNYSVIGGGANGIELTSTIGNEDAFTDVTVAVSGIELQSTITPVGTSANSDNEIAHSFLLTGSLGSSVIEGTALVEPTGIIATTSISGVEAAPIQQVDVTGIQISALVGNEDTSGNANISVTGISATFSIGDIVPVSKYDATGSELTTSLGSVTAVGEAVVIPTGISLTASTGSPNIVAWAEVDTGTSVTWSEVDLAA